MPLKTRLPKPVFVGTPKFIVSPNLEKVTGKLRGEVLIPEGATNVAAGRPVTGSDPSPFVGSYALITNGDKEATGAAEGNVQEVFDKMTGSFKADAAAGVDVIFQFNISGEGGGDWYCVIKDATCTIDAGVHEKPVCTIKMADEDFLAMMGGKLPPMQAFTSGKLKIQGDVMKSQLLEKLFVIG